MSACPYLEDLTVDLMLDAFDRMGYDLSAAGDYDINLFGIRTAERVSNTFNDAIGALFLEDGTWQMVVYDGTTDPGDDSRLNPVNERGCAILAPGQHKGAFKLGYHKGKYRALVQNNPLPLYRDNNCDEVIDDVGEARYEMAGINLHRANARFKSKLVDSYSAGCCVIADPNDFNELLDLAEESAVRYGDSFTFTLFTEEQVFDEE